MYFTPFRFFRVLFRFGCSATSSSGLTCSISNSSKAGKTSTNNQQSRPKQYYSRNLFWRALQGLIGSSSLMFAIYRFNRKSLRKFRTCRTNSY